MKIIGYTVGTTLPKPNLKQTDPTKGDYVKGKEILDEQYIKIDEQELTDEQKAQVRMNVNAVSIEEASELTDGVAFIDVEDNTTVVDPSDRPSNIAVQPDWDQNDPNAPDYIKNRPFYEETTETSIEGMVIEGFPIASGSAEAHNINLPLALGQEWAIYKNNGSMEGVWTVQQAEDGSLFLGGSPVRITEDTIECNSQWVRMLSVTKIYIVGVSGTATVTTIQKIDPKYLPASGVMIVKLAFDSDGTTLLADKTYPQVKAALDAGQLVRMLDTDGMSYLDVDFASSMLVRFAHTDITQGTAIPSILLIACRKIELYSYTNELTAESKEYRVNIGS